MKAQIKAIELSAKQGKYDGASITYQGEPFEGKQKDPTTRFIFDNSDLASVVKTLEVGDWVEIQFKKEGKFYNPVSIEKVSAPQQEQRPSPQREKTNNVSDLPYSAKQQVFADMEKDKQRSISRSVALAQAVQLVVAKAAAGGYTAANLKKVDFLGTEALALAVQFFPYLIGETGSDSVNADIPPFAVVDQPGIE